MTFQQKLSLSIPHPPPVVVMYMHTYVRMYILCVCSLLTYLHCISTAVTLIRLYTLCTYIRMYILAHAVPPCSASAKVVSDREMQRKASHNEGWWEQVSGSPLLD